MPESPVPLSKIEKIKQNFYKGGVRFGIESIAQQVIQIAEIGRAALVNPKAFGEMGEIMAGLTKPAILSPENTNPYLYTFLQNSGDFYDGFTFSYFTYNSIALADFLQSTITGKRLPLIFKLGTTVALNTTGVLITESGIFSATNTISDWYDVPMGLAGTLCYAGINLLGRRLAKNWITPFATTTPDKKLLP